MKVFLPILALITAPLALAEESEPDFLRFKNGDTLHGTFLGIEEGPILKWQSQEAKEAINFETNNLRKLSLNNGRAQTPLTSAGLIELNTGDRLPGTLVAMSAESVTLQTEFAGLITIPRETVRLILPNRHGSNVLYAGPFNDQDWEVPGTRELPENEDEQKKDLKEAKAEGEEKFVAEAGENLDPGEEEAIAEALAEVLEEGDAGLRAGALVGGMIGAKADLGEKIEEAQVPEAPWVYGGASWMSNSDQVIRLNTKLPDMVSVRFKLAWQAPLNASIALFSDFQRPQPEPAQPRVRRAPEKKNEDDPEKPDADDEPDEEKQAEEEDETQWVDIMEIGPGKTDTESFGSGYLLTLGTSYSRLQRMGFDDDLKAKKSSFPNSGGRLSMGDLFSADFEIRGDRQEGKVSLFVNGEFYSEWQDLADPLAEGDSYFALSSNKSPIRISDVVVSEWNGMPDSARSMQTEERDVLLLANGTDRISGQVVSMSESIFAVETAYGMFKIPVAEVTDLHLATNSVAAPPEPTGEETLISLQPNGLLTVIPRDGIRDSLNAEHPILGELTLDLRFAYLLEFDPIGSIFDNWDDEF